MAGPLQNSARRATNGADGTVQGKVVIVTGAASGIGRATVDAAAAPTGPRWSAPTSPTPTSSATASPTCRPTSRDEGAVAALVATAVAAGTAASTASSTRPGVAGGGPVHLLDAAEWERVIAVNLTGTFLVAKHALGQMLEQDAGRRRAGLARHPRQRRGPRGHGRRQRLQRVEGRRRAAHQEHGHRLRPARHPGQRHLPRLHRHADDRLHLRDGGHARCSDAVPSTSTPCAASASPRRSRPPPPSSCRATPASSPARPCPVDGGYTAGRDHGITKLMGIGDA